MKTLTFTISSLMFGFIMATMSVVTTFSQDAKPKVDVQVKAPETFTVKDFKPEDQAKIQDLSKSVVDIQKDIELAQTRIQLAQSQLTRVNEVQLPALEKSLRDTYKLPTEQWDWSVQTLTFTKKK